MRALKEQKTYICRLGDIASDRKRRAQHYRGQIKDWQRDHLGRLDTLAWIYAAGVAWGVRKSDARQRPERRGHTLRFINTALIASRLFGTQAIANTGAEELSGS